MKKRNMLIAALLAVAVGAILGPELLHAKNQAARAVAKAERGLRLIRCMAQMPLGADLDTFRSLPTPESFAHHTLGMCTGNDCTHAGLFALDDQTSPPARTNIIAFARRVAGFVASFDLDRATREQAADDLADLAIRCNITYEVGRVLDRFVEALAEVNNNPDAVACRATCLPAKTDTTWGFSNNAAALIDQSANRSCFADSCPELSGTPGIVMRRLAIAKLVNARGGQGMNAQSLQALIERVRTRMRLGAPRSTK